MTKVQIPWGAWYNAEPFILELPDEWNVEVCRMKGGKDIGEEGIRRALAAPIGAPSLREFARGRDSAAILVDDLSRPTPAFRLLPYVLEELAAAGIDEDRVKIIFALAAHRPMTRGQGSGFSRRGHTDGSRMSGCPASRNMFIRRIPQK